MCKMCGDIAMCKINMGIVGCDAHIAPQSVEKAVY